MNLLKELNDIIVLSEDKNEGTYVGAKFSDDTVKKLKKLAKDLKIDNYVGSDKLHTTIIYSRKKFPDNFKAQGDLTPMWKGVPETLEIFPTRNNKNALVLRYSCKQQLERHEQLMNKYKATYDWPEYKIHLTLSYDCGDYDANSIDITNYIDEIEISTEYTEELKLDWNNDKSDKTK